MLCDTGPMVAMVDRHDPYHARCLAALVHIPPDGFLTTWPCLAEAMYLLFRRLGYLGQDHLWDLVADDVIVLDRPEKGDQDRMRELMRQYQDAPMDLADASLVSTAERLELRQIFTTDSHFRAYRIQDRHAFEILP